MAEKTELPTDKKRKDSAKKGQTLKSRDFTTAVVLLSGSYFILYGLTFSDFISVYTYILLGETDMSIRDFLLKMIIIFFKLTFPLIFICSVSGIIATLLQTRFTIATEALKVNFKAVNPVEGIKKLFSMRTVKDFFKSLCYIIVFTGTCYNLIHLDLRKALAIYHAGIGQLGFSLLSLSVKAVTVFTAWSAVVIFLDFIVEYFIHTRELKMDKHEVKQERKETDGNPQIKSARRRAHHELLSGEDKAAIRNSKVVMVNPTHIAIAIYFNPEVASLPFIALRASNYKAQATLAYAKENGIPVICNICLSRRLFYSYSQYSFISLNDDALIEVMDIIIWLLQVETAGLDRESPDAAIGNDAAATDLGSQ